jgi:hypothetical protein
LEPGANIRFPLVKILLTDFPSIEKIMGPFMKRKFLARILEKIRYSGKEKTGIRRGEGFGA